MEIETTKIIVTALTNSFIGQMIKSGWEGINKNELLNKDVGQLIREGKYLFLREYTQRYWDRHGIIKVLKMSNPMDLESIYVNVKCLGNLVRDYYDENLENKYRESKQRRFNFRDDGKKDGLLLANQEQYLMVLGDPGIGKSTFLRKVGLEALKGNKDSYQHSLTPVLLDLKNFKENEINIQALIEEEFKICGFPNVEKNISNKLEKGELLILLDGLDEVPTASSAQAKPTPTTSPTSSAQKKPTSTKALSPPPSAAPSASAILILRFHDIKTLAPRGVNNS